MGPAVLLCPSSAVQLLGQVSPSKASRQKPYSSHSERGRQLLRAHWKLDFFRCSTRFWPNVAAQTRNRNTPCSWRVCRAAVGEEVSVEEPVAENTVESESGQEEQPPKIATNGENTDSSAVLKTQRRRSGPRRDSRNRVANSALVPGATFTGKVTTIQSFGAFVDFGGFTNGLIHISRLSKAFVKNVEDVVQLGQEVNVQVLDVDLQAKRISLMLMQDEKQQDGERVAGGTDREGSGFQQGKGARRGESQRRSTPSPPATTLKKGETVTGVVKNIVKSGVFVTLPDSVDGFLPATETNFRGANVRLEAQFKVGQELSVRVLRIERGRVRLTAKQEIDMAKINESINREMVGGATNPFEIAFRQNAVISSYLEEKQKFADAAEGKGVEAEPEAAAEDVSEGESSSVPPEEESTEVSSDDQAALSGGVSLLENSAEEDSAQAQAISQDSSEGPAEALLGKSLEPVVDKDISEKISNSTEFVDEPELIKQVLEEGVQSGPQESDPVEEVLVENEAAIDDNALAFVKEESTGKEAVIEGLPDAAGEVEAVAGETATEEVATSTEELPLPAEDSFNTKEATANEVGGPIKEIAPVKEAAGVNDVAAIDHSVAPVEKELTKAEVINPDLEAQDQEISAAAEEVVSQVEGVVSAVEGAMTAVEEAVTRIEERLEKPEVALQEHVASAEEAVAAGEGKLGDVVVPEAIVEGLVEGAVSAVKEELSEKSPVQEFVASVKKAEAEGEEDKPLISKEDDDVSLKVGKASSGTEAALMGAQKTQDHVQENELSPSSHSSKENKAMEKSAVDVIETPQENAEMEAVEVVGVKKQDN